MLELSLPGFDYKVKKAKRDGDDIRYRPEEYVVLTPEEWVRQHVVHYLVERKDMRSLRLPSKEKLNCMA